MLMQRIPDLTKRCFYIACVTALCLVDPAGAESWQSFLGDGSAASDRGPEKIDPESSDSLAWQVQMPGRSVASPIVVDEKVISTSAAGPDEDNVFVTAVSLEDGQLLWQHKFRSTGRPYHHPTGSNAAPSPASNGDAVVAFFSSNDLACLGVDGELRWFRGLGSDYPKAGNDIGMASSPVIVDDVVMVLVEAQGDSFVAAIDLQTGTNLWRSPRSTNSNWSSPRAITRADGSKEVVIQSSSQIVAYDPKSGSQKWSIDEGRSSIATPTTNGRLLFLPGDGLIALDLDSNETGTPEEQWRADRLSGGNASMTIGNERVYSLDGSVLTAAELASGDTVWKKRLSGLGGTWATPVLAGNLLYAFDQSGKGIVVRDTGDDAEIITDVDLGEGVLGTPAIADGRLIVRSQRKLFCFK